VRSKHREIKVQIVQYFCRYTLAKKSSHMLLRVAMAQDIVDGGQLARKCGGEIFA